MALRNFAEFAPPNPPLGRLPGWKLPGVGRVVGRWPDLDPPKFGSDTPCFCRHSRNEELPGRPLDPLDPDDGVDELLAAEHPLASTAASSTGPATRQDR
jgi:hypothetical protein